MPAFPAPSHNTRLGFEYFPDTQHYRLEDLQRWLPEIQAMGASWLALQAPPTRAIPEDFIRTCIDSRLEPVMRFNFPIEPPPPPSEIELIFRTYARWGIHYTVLFNQPNQRSSWPATTWARQDLVERFLDSFLPLAQLALDAGLTPVFPPLAPGGDYWDTAFLRTALVSIERRGSFALLDHLVIGAYAHPGDRPLDWGSGGPERWPAVKPYHTPPGSQDQRGFHIYDWYLALARAVIGDARPLLLFGLSDGIAAHHGSSSRKTVAIHRLIAIAQALVANSCIKAKQVVRPIAGESLDPLPSQVLAGFFDKLTSDPQWFDSEGSRGLFSEALRRWNVACLGEVTAPIPKNGSALQRPPIAHYLLLPKYDWGIAEWHLNAAKPFIRKYQPAIGFSLSEAACAARVTVVGGVQEFPEQALSELRAAGCLVERIDGDGTSIATELSEK
jgi:hypothetical protein